MTHLNEERLVLHYYGDADDNPAAERHLAECEDCQAKFAALRRAMSALDSIEAAEPRLGFESRVWRRLEERVHPRPLWTRLPRWAMAAAAAAVMAGAFYMGRLSTPAARPPVVEIAVQQPARERILMAAVGEHVERSQIVLVELANARPARSLDISNERQSAEDLLDSNRLYRQTAISAGDDSLAALLEDLERLLLEIAHSPSRLSARQIDDLRYRMEAQGILFKLRTLRTRTREEY